MLIDLGQQWQKYRDHWTALERRARAMAEGPDRDTLAERQEKIGRECDAICDRMIALPARDLADLAVLLDVALEMDVAPQRFPEDRPMVGHVLSEMSRLAPNVEFGALRRGAALDLVTLIDPAESRETPARLAQIRAERQAAHLARLPLAAAAALRPSELWLPWALAQMEITALERGHLSAAVERRIEQLDYAVSAMRARMQELPIADAADLAAAMDVMLDIDVDTVSDHVEDRPVLEHLVAQLNILAPTIDIGALRRSDSSPRWDKRAA
jgi:hypothetical protein